eukprot:365142-Chlamydomonas_euryale.AAC.6
MVRRGNGDRRGEAEHEPTWMIQPYGSCFNGVLEHGVAEWDGAIGRFRGQDGAGELWGGARPTPGWCAPPVGLLAYSTASCCQAWMAPPPLCTPFSIGPLSITASTSRRPFSRLPPTSHMHTLPCLSMSPKCTYILHAGPGQDAPDDQPACVPARVPRHQRPSPCHRAQVNARQLVQ